ncbi:hypothetical protein PHISCL_01240 [Aspergillus sclerotialis]|uniref:Uncharacterized protein n=1 Tax=Aspergillus sclerotialis TaxID=2070753 RepID=A0A3A2ZTF7_9EURO|nr:hypothetical protein PHISCL_01240 [Aspergillus sclerotialis]
MSYSNGQRFWGFTIPRGAQLCSWSKLLLDRDAKPVQFDDSELQIVMRLGILQLPDGMEAVSVVADFLRHVHEYLSSLLIAHAYLPTDFWFTVPAAWSENARTLMGEAMANAGFGERQQDRVLMMSEPEAAALAVISYPGNDLKPGDGLLVCDCGGGTVDITTYYITGVRDTTDLTNVTPKVFFEQLTAAIGAKCGGEAVDMRFYSLLSAKLGQEFNNLPLNAVGPWASLMDDFEIVKANFDGQENRTFRLALNINAPKADPTFFNQRTRKITLEARDIRSLYDPVLHNVLDLVMPPIRALKKKYNRKIINGTGRSSRSDYSRLARRISPNAHVLSTFGVASAPPIPLNHDGPRSAEFTSTPMEWDVCWVLGKV